VSVVVVSDASPLINLARVAQLELLDVLAVRVLTTELGEGEAAAIVLAQEQRASLLLID